VSEVIDQFIKLVLNALRHANHYYTRRAKEFLNKMGAKGIIIVSNYRPPISQCGLACSMGVGGVGIIFIERSFFEDKRIPEELKEFIIAHELVHIVRSHVVPTILTRMLFQLFSKALEETIDSVLKSKELPEVVVGIAFFLFWLYGSLGLVKIDAELIRAQELEADSLAVQLTSCNGARYFIELLRVLKEWGYDVSHEALLGFPALTIEERIDNLQRLCSISPSS
jgi:Zn-dependent protease with chaperone function